MKAFRTVVVPPEYPFQLQRQDYILSIGSCFAAHIGSRLLKYKFNLLLNPFGILFNPVSIARCLGFGLEIHKPSEMMVVRNDEMWHSMDHHGSFSSLKREDVEEKISQTNSKLHEFLQNTKLLILTFGTAYGYEFRQNKQIVANCHKMPASFFNKKLASPKQIIHSLFGPMEKLYNINPNLKVLLSVSPVRHIRDSLIQNQLSKSTLIISCHHLCQTFSFCHYFPAYEMLLDDLRDYRFYKVDMIHPHELAIQYVWERFQQSLLQDKDDHLMQALDKIYQSLEHRPIHPDSTAHKLFLDKLLQQIQDLEQQYPQLDFKEEYALLNKGKR